MKILDWNEIEEAALILKNGGVLAFPTETVYGIGSKYSDEAAFRKVVSIKRRPPDKPFALMCSSLEEASHYVDVSKKELELMERFLPGQITFLVKAKKGLPHHVTLGTPIIGIRVPDHELVRKMIASVGEPCLVTSANISGEPTSTSFEETKKSFEGCDVDGIVEGPCTSKLASTIVLLKDGTITQIREGHLKFEEIMQYWRDLQ